LLARIRRLTEPHRFDVLQGNKVLEVRCLGMNKGKAVMGFTKGLSGDFIMAAGDDTTDEDMFAVLPAQAYTVKVGRGSTKARFFLEGPAELRALLTKMAFQ